MSLLLLLANQNVALTGQSVSAAQGTVPAAFVPIAFVGSGTGSSMNAAGSVAFSSLLDTAGGTPSVLAGDFVVVFTSKGTKTGGGAVVLTTSGYTQAGTDAYGSGSSAEATVSAFYKFMGGTPDTSVAWSASGAAEYPQAVIVYVFRNVNVTTPLDVTTTIATGTGGGQADAPSITPTSTGTWVVAGGAGGLNDAMNAYAVPSNATNTTNYFRHLQAGAADQVTELGGAIYSGWTSGAFDMAVFGGTVNNNVGSAWGAVTVALRRAVPVLTAIPVTGQGVVVNQGVTGRGVPLTGQSLTIARGTVAPTTSPTLAGQALAAGQGILAPTAVYAITGRSLVVGQGTVTANIYYGPTAALTGQATALGLGSLGVISSSTVALAGFEVTVAQATFVVPLGSFNLSVGLGTLTVASSSFVISTVPAAIGAIGSPVPALVAATSGTVPPAVITTGGAVPADGSFSKTAVPLPPITWTRS